MIRPLDKKYKPIVTLNGFKLKPKEVSVEISFNIDLCFAHRESRTLSIRDETLKIECKYV